MDLEIFNETKKILNNPLIDTKLLEKKHLIFIKYTSEIYYKYSIELIETLCKKSKFGNRKLLFHTTLSFLLKILYNCGNTPCLDNFDLLILCVFSLSIKSIENINKTLSINKLKSIYPEKFCNYKNNEIKLGEIISIKILDYNINILTPYESIFYLLYENNNLHLFDKCIQHLDNLIINGDKNFIFKKPLDIAKENIEYVKMKEKEKININNNMNNLILSVEKKLKTDLKKEKKIKNNESISTNTSSNNMSNYINNSIFSSGNKSNFKNKMLNKFKTGERITDFNPGSNIKNEINDKLKINLTYFNIDKNNIDNSFIKQKESRYLYNLRNNNIKNSNNISVTEKRNIFKNNLLMKNNNSKTNISYITKDNKISNSPNISKKLDKINHKDIKEKFMEYNETNSKNILKGNTYKSINTKFKNGIINNSINFKNTNNSINFNYNMVSELCKKMNFDFFAEKIK
jgi:hypothetical protein